MEDYKKVKARKENAEHKIEKWKNKALEPCLEHKWSNANKKELKLNSLMKKFTLFTLLNTTRDKILMEIKDRNFY